jgi:hypothetical protein
MGEILDGNTHPLLTSLLKAKFDSLDFAVPIHWIPDQSEDIHWIVIDDRRVAVVMIPRRIDLRTVVEPIEIMDLHELRKRRLSAEVRRNLEAATLLLKERAERGR